MIQVERNLIFGRYVVGITSQQGQNNYYEHLNYWRTCVKNTNKRIVPTIEQAEEYIRLKDEKTTCFEPIETRKKYRKLQQYTSQYDWRPTKSYDGELVGLKSPTGEQLLPNYFIDVFSEFDAINNRPDFIPVFNGEAWALVTLSAQPTLMTDFRYSKIIPERWESKLFFVQNAETMKWGVYIRVNPFLNHVRHHRCSLPTLAVLMPCIADEIYEDELLTDCEPTLFFMTRIGDKIGILTYCGYSPIVFDEYETDDEHISFRLLRHDIKRARHADWSHPDGKHLYINLNRRKKKH